VVERPDDTRQFEPATEPGKPGREMLRIADVDLNRRGIRLFKG